MRFFGVTPINWEDSSWKQLSLVNDEEVISLSHAKVYVFSDSVQCLGKMNQNPQSNTVWEHKLTWFKSSSQYRTFDTIDREPIKFEWNISQDSPHCSSATKSQEFMSKMSDPSECKGRIIFMSMFNDILWGSEDNEQECNANDNLVFYFFREDFHQEDGHSSDLNQKRSGILLMVVNRASKFVCENAYTFDRRSSTRRFIAKVQRTSGMALTTKR